MLKEREADVMKDSEENKSLTPTKDVSTNTLSRYIKLEEEESEVSAPVSEAQSSLANAKGCKGGEIQITPSLTENSNPEVTSELGCANETRLATETHTGNETSSLDNLKHGDDKSKISEGESSLAKTKFCDHLIFPRVQSPSLMDVNELQDKSDVKGQISELEIPLDNTKASVSAAEIVDLNDNDRVSQKIAEDANKNVENSKSYVSIQTSEGQSSRCESAVEIIDINNNDRVFNISSDEEDAAVTNVSKVENLLEKFESLKQRISDCIHSQGSPGKLKKHKSDDIITETVADCDDLIIVESCMEVERVIAGSDPEVMEVDGGSTDEQNQHVSNDKRRVNKTSTKSKREGPKGKVTSSWDEARGCGSAVEIIDVDDNQSLHKSTNNTNRDTSFKCCTDAKSRACPSPSVKRCGSTFEIVDLNDDDEVVVKDREIINVHGRQISDVAKACKRGIFDRITDEMNSDAEVAAQIREVNGSSAKRPKRDDDDVNFSSDCNRLESTLDPNTQGKNYNRDVEIIEDDDDEIHRSANYTNENVAKVESCANETKVWRNRGNVKDSSDKVSSREDDVGILDLQGRPGDGAERQSLLEEIESCKRRVSDSNSTDEVNLDVESDAQAQIIGTEDSSAKHVKSANVTNPGGKTREESCAKAQSSVGAGDEDEQINNKNSPKAHISEAESLLAKSDVEIVAVHENDQVLRKSTQEPNQDDTKSENDVNKTIIQALSAKGPISEVHSSSVKNKSCKTVSEIVDVHDDNRANDTNQIIINVGSCVKSHVNKLQNESAAETMDASDERERAPSDERNFDVTNDGICIESCVSEVPKAAEDRGFAGKNDFDEPSRDVTTSEVPGCERDVEDALVEENNNLALPSFTDELNLYVTASESCAKPQIGGDVSSSTTFEHCESDPESQADQDGEFAGEQSEATNQSAHGEEVDALPHPTSSQANHEFNYVELRQEENINLIRARLRGMEEKLRTLMNSHR